MGLIKEGSTANGAEYEIARKNGVRPFFAVIRSFKIIKKFSFGDRSKEDSINDDLLHLFIIKLENDGLESALAFLDKSQQKYNMLPTNMLIDKKRHRLFRSREPPVQEKDNPFTPYQLPSPQPQPKQSQPPSRQPAPPMSKFNSGLSADDMRDLQNHFNFLVTELRLVHLRSPLEEQRRYKKYRIKCRAVLIELRQHYKNTIDPYKDAERDLLIWFGEEILRLPLDENALLSL